MSNNYYKEFLAELLTNKNYNELIDKAVLFIENLEDLPIEDRPLLYHETAWLHSKIGKEYEAVKYCDYGIELIKKSNHGQHLYADLYFQKGISLSRLYDETSKNSEKLKEAENAFDKSIYYSFRDFKNFGFGAPFYTYRSINKFTLKDLINNEITVVNPKRFNDPFDCVFDHFLQNRRNSTFNNEALKKSYSKIRMRSFVGEEIMFLKPDKRKTPPYKDILMWSHYANAHKGICVQYNLSHNFGKNGEHCYHQFFEEKYTEDIVDISGGDKFNIEKGFLTKHQSWSYEEEIRFLYFDPECNSDFVSLPLDKESKVTAIYFGLYCSKWYISRIKNIFKGQKVDFYQMNKSLTDIYNLTASKIE
jgi:hypothetical protein